jgi:hypothetical protein
MYDRSLCSDATEGLLLPSSSWYSDHLSDEPSDAVVLRSRGRRVVSDCVPGPHQEAIAAWKPPYWSWRTWFAATAASDEL